MKWSPICLFLLFIVYTSKVYAQNSENQISRELGLRIDVTSLLNAQLQQGNLIYKYEVDSLTFRRIQMMDLYFRTPGSPDTRGYIGGNIIWGKEKRVPLKNDLYFIHGLQYIAGFNISNMIRLNPGVGYVLGIQKNIGSQFAIGAEVLPILSSSIDLRNNSVVFSGLYGNFSSRNGQLSLLYRF